MAADCWTSSPPGAFSWGIWNFSRNKAPAKELMEFLSQRENVEERCRATVGYGVPPFASMTDFKVRDDVEAPGARSIIT